MLRTLLLHRGWRAALIAAAALASVVFLYSVRMALPPFLVALVIAYALEPAVSYLHRRGLARSWAILVMYILVGLLVGAAVAFVLPVFVSELGRLGQVIPEYIRGVDGFLGGMERRYERWPLPPAVKQALDAQIGRVEGALLASVATLTQGLFALFGQAFTLLVAPILAFYMLLDLPLFRRRIEVWLPAGSRSEAWAFFRDVDRVLGGFIRGQVIVSAAVGLLTAVAMGLLGVPFAAVLGMAAAVLNVIPYFGSFLGAVPGLLLAATVSFALAAKVALAYVAIQQVEAAVLVPRIMGRTVGLHPMALIFALLVGGTYLGVVGLVLAVPAAGLIRVAASFSLRWLSGAHTRR